MGETLAAHTSDIGDADGLSNVTYSYQWLANDGTSDTDITDATDSTYTLAAADEGQTIRVKVTFTDDAGNGETLTSVATEAVSFAVQQQQANTPATGTPTITGTAQVGETLAAHTSDIGDADGLANVTYSYQWLANDGGADIDIENATDSTYTLAADDEGQTIRVKVTFTDDAGNEETLTSVATEAVSLAGQQQQANTPATGTPTITGTAQVGETLAAHTSDIGDADGLANVTYSYQWLANDGTSDTDFTDATDSTYTLAADDEGQTIRVKVTFTDDAGNDETLTSVATNEVANAGPTEPPPAPENLTAVENADGTVTLTWDAPDDDSVTGYQILRRIPAAGEGAVSVLVEDTGSAATSYADTEVAAGTRYIYRVKAINEAGVGPRSGRAVITTSG